MVTPLGLVVPELSVCVLSLAISVRRKLYQFLYIAMSQEVNSTIAVASGIREVPSGEVGFEGLDGVLLLCLPGCHEMIILSSLPPWSSTCTLKSPC